MQVDTESVRAWISRRLFELQGEEDEILVSLVLEEMRSGNLRVSLSSFLGKETEQFVSDLESFARKLEEANKAALAHAETMAN